MTTDGEQGVPVPDDVARLREEFPAWDFDVAWRAAGSGPDARWLVGRPRGGWPQVVAPDAESMRRAIREGLR